MATKKQKSSIRRVQDKKVKNQKSLKKKTTSGAKKMLYLLGGVAALGPFGFLGYSTLVYQSSDEEQEGFFVCNKENTVCELSQHIHSDLDMNVCGKEVIFPKEKGKLDRQHTHKEENYLHWHARMKVDSKTREPLDKSLLSIGAFLEQMNYTFPESCDANTAPELSVSINGDKKAEGLKATWKDGDKIVVEYQ